VRRLTAFCMAAAEPGRVVMFDEPTNDVDPVRRKLLWAQVRALGEAGCAVLLVTHNVVEAERAVQQLVILDQGRVVAQGTPAELRGKHVDRFRLELVAADHPTAQQLAREVGGAEPPVVSGRRLTVPIEQQGATAALAWAQREREATRVDEFSLTPVSLEDVYIRLVGSGNGGSDVEEVDHASLVA
jgi:ABC-2 type transport system ATP-binding protein